jgi:ubiquinone/menaquinone biosynthesis C-methylase UbiE
MTATTDPPQARFARMYQRSAQTAERSGATEHRHRLLGGLSGTVLELGAGHGLNFPHYPADVTEVVAIEPEPTLRAKATETAATAAVRVCVLAGTANELPIEDQTMDAAVANLMLCSVPDQDLALAELYRVVRPGGELRFYEHVIPNGQPKRLLLQVADRRGIWPRIAGGCHPARDTTAAIDRSGFEIQTSERIMFASSRGAVDPVRTRQRTPGVTVAHREDLTDATAYRRGVPVGDPKPPLERYSS